MLASRAGIALCGASQLNKQVGIMSLEVLEQLESKVQSAVDNISLLKMELDDLKQQNNQLQDENHQLRNEHVAWQERLRALLGKIDQMDEAI